MSVFAKSDAAVPKFYTDRLPPKVLKSYVAGVLQERHLRMIVRKGTRYRGPNYGFVFDKNCQELFTGLVKARKAGKRYIDPRAVSMPTPEFTC